MTAWQRANDAELISAVRDDDLAAWAELCHRHLEAARRLAHTLVPAKAADELVVRVAERVLAELRRGEGPDMAFRTYLLAEVRSEQPLSVVPRHGVQPPGRPEARDTRPAVRAFRTLPERWQLVLWHLDVEHDDPGRTAPLIGVAARSVPAIAGRARTGLREATLELHAREADDPDPDCGWTRQHLPAYLRGAATRRESGRVSTHVQGCTPCRSAHDELAAVDDDLAGILGPLVLGSAAAGYLTTRKAGAFARHPGRAALVGVAAAVVLITGAALGLGGTAEDPPAAEAPVLRSPSASLPSTDSGVILEPSASAKPDDQAPPTASGDPSTAPSSVPPTATQDSSPPPPGSPSDDSTLTPPDTSVPPGSPPPPTTPPPSGADPAVTADPPKPHGPVSLIQVAVEDVDETADRQLTIEVTGSDVELSGDPRCTPLDEAGYSVCDLSEDASAISLIANVSEVDGIAFVEFVIRPKPGVQENLTQRDNNRAHVTLLPPPHED